MAKQSCFKIGPKAESFYDPRTGVKVLRTLPWKGSLEHLKNWKKVKGKQSPLKRLQDALAGGHIVEISEDEYNTLMEKHQAAAEVEENSVKDVTEMSQEELIEEASQYLEGDALDQFKGYKMKKMRSTLLELREEAANEGK